MHDDVGRSEGLPKILKAYRVLGLRVTAPVGPLLCDSNGSEFGAVSLTQGLKLTVRVFP